MRAEIAQPARRDSPAGFPVAEGVDLQHGLAGDAESLQDVPAAGDHLGVGKRLGGADQLDVDLVELAVAALLRALVAEHRAGAEHLLRQRLGEAVGHQRAADAGGGLGAQRDGIAAAVLEAVHLLHHHVGGFAERAGEHAGVLEDRRGPLVEAVGGGDAAGGVDHVLMAALVLADQVVGAAGGLEFGHCAVAGSMGCLHLAVRKLAVAAVPNASIVGADPAADALCLMDTGGLRTS